MPTTFRLLATRLDSQHLASNSSDSNFFHRKKPSTLAFNTSASSNSCGVKWGPRFDFSGHLEGMGMLFQTSHDWSGWQLIENLQHWYPEMAKLSFLRSIFLLKIWMYDAGVQKHGEDYLSQQLQWNQLHENFAKFHGCENKTHEDFSHFLLANSYFDPWPVLQSFKYLQAWIIKKKHQHMTTQPSLKPIRYTWRKTLERCSGAPVDVLHRPHLSNASTNIQALARRWLTWHLGSVNKKPPVTWAIKNWLVNDGISYNSPSIYPYLVG